MAERFERHRQAWTSDEVRKLHLLAGKGMALKALAKALTRQRGIDPRPRQGGRARDRQAALAGDGPEQRGKGRAGAAAADPPLPDARVAQAVAPNIFNMD